MITITVDNEIFAMRCMVTFLSKDYSLIRLRCRDILYFEYFERKIRIVTKDTDYICINEKIGDIARRMKPYGFSMCHQSFVVNMYQIDRITPQLLIMKNVSNAETVCLFAVLVQFTWSRRI